MSLNNAKRFVALYFLVMLVVCSSTAFAQDADWRQASSSERKSEKLEIAPRTDGAIIAGEIPGLNNSEDSASNYYFRSKIKIDARNERVVIEPEISEIGELKIKADIFAAPNTKSNIGFNRRRESSVEVSVKNSHSIFQPDIFVKETSRYFRPAVNLNIKPFSFNQEASQSEKAKNILYAASETQGATPFDNDDKDKSDDTANKTEEGFRWRSATGQTLMFLAIQHGYAFTQPKTREALKGKFWKDYVKSVKSLRGWADGGRFFTNYIAHPMQGSFLGYIQVQNDPKGLKQQFGTSGDYWRSRLKAMAWSAAWSTQFEIGPVSQASIGNVGLKGKQTYIDIVVTPTVGTAWLIGEDAIDRFVMKRIERSTDNFYAVIFARMLLSPTRTIANVFRFKTPWYRDRPRAK